MTAAAAPILEVRNLNKRYGAETALHDVTFSAASGEFIVVLGRSGAGKSTLMRCINRLVEPSGGEIRFEGAPVPTGRRNLRRMRRRIGMIFQQFNLVKRLSVLTNVLTGTLGYKPLLPSLAYLFGREEKLAALECLERVNMAHKAFQRADTLSGGEQQRVAIARVLNQKPALLLADEPVASLDPTIARTVLRDLRRINEDMGITVVLNIHQVNYAREFGERVIGLAGGGVVFDGHVRELTDDVLHRVYGEVIDDKNGDHERA
jgi:phosphonate transport system ATP-binding protein